MKKCIVVLIALILSSCYAKTEESETDEKFQEYFKEKKSEFIGKNIAEFLANTSKRSYKSYYFNEEPPGRISSLNIYYDTIREVRIYSDDFKKIPSANSSDWPIETVHRMKIKSIKYIWK